MLVLILAPLFESKPRLPFFTWLPFDTYASTFSFSMVYAFQFLCAVYAGGSNVSVNMYIFLVLDCVNFILQLFNTRLANLGYANYMEHQASEIPFKKISFYRETIECIMLHLKIDKYVTK